MYSSTLVYFLEFLNNVVCVYLRDSNDNREPSAALVELVVRLDRDKSV